MPGQDWLRLWLLAILWRRARIFMEQFQVLPLRTPGETGNAKLKNPHEGLNHCLVSPDSTAAH
jgi:hypothetical protein